MSVSARPRLRAVPAAAVRVLATAACLFLILPLVIVIPVSFTSTSYLRFPPADFSLRWYALLLRDPGWAQSFAFSVEVAVMATLLSVVVGSMAAVALVRGRFPLRGVIISLMLLPIMLPSVVVAVGLLIVVSRWHMVGNPLAIALGHALISLPIVVTIVSAALSQFDISLEQTAIVFGAHPLVAFRRVTMPLIAPAIWSAVVFSFLTSFDELLIALFTTNPTQVTLPIRIFNATIFTLDPTIAAVSSLLIGLTACALAAVILIGGGRSLLGSTQARSQAEPETPMVA